jgi:hypothetical protein
VTNEFERSHALFSGLENALAALGFRTVTDLLNERPGVGYLKVSDELEKAAGYGDVSLSAAALQYRHLKEALLRGEYLRALADSFVRCIQSNGRVRRAGWGNTPSTSDLISVISFWTAGAKVVAKQEANTEIEAEIDRAGDLIWNAPPPKGWIPKSGDDPIIKNAIGEAFRNSPLK